MSELKECPFCGLEPIQIKDLGTNYRHPEEEKSKRCVVHGVITDIDLWNTRPIEDALRQRIKELEAKLAVLCAAKSQ